MKTKVFFFPTALVLAVLTGCSNSNGAPVQNADGNLSPGIMQPLESTGASSGGWQPEIQQQSMPASMNVQQAVQQPIGQLQQHNQQAQAAQAAASDQARHISQDFTIPRDTATNAPIYNQIDKGFYKGDRYTVRKGDTMFLVAYISGMDVAELAAKNNMSEPYNLRIGQVLKIDHGHATAELPPAGKVVTGTQKTPNVTYTPGPNHTQYGSDGTITGPVKASASNTAAATQQSQKTAAAAVTKQPSAVSPSIISWRWPVSGKVIQGFSSSDGGNKGLDISGSRGQAVNAAAAGRVVYAGNALRGYGNLIIIKHNDDFLSAYAHNESILVKDQQQVSAGQQIAKMGSSGTNAVKLHFEIRFKGKSVDPARYLPSR